MLRKILKSLKSHILEHTSLWVKVICLSLFSCCSIFLETAGTIRFKRCDSFEVLLVSSCREVFIVHPHSPQLPLPPFFSSGKYLQVSYSSLMLSWSVCDFLSNCSSVFLLNAGKAVTVLFTVSYCSG